METNQQVGSALGGAVGIVLVLVWLAVVLACIISMWRVFSKAGQPGWAIFIPIYNTYVLCKVAGKSGWWVLLLFIPVVNIVIALLLALGVAENFGKGAGFGIGIFFLPFIFYPILAFGDASYQVAPA